jgi:hypothetical protein
MRLNDTDKKESHNKYRAMGVLRPNTHGIPPPPLSGNGDLIDIDIMDKGGTRRLTVSDFGLNGPVTWTVADRWDENEYGHQERWHHHKPERVVYSSGGRDKHNAVDITLFASTECIGLKSAVFGCNTPQHT